MAYMLTGYETLYFSGSCANTDREMDSIRRNVVQNGADDRFTNCVKVIITDHNHRPANTVDAENITLFGFYHLPNLISLGLTPVKLADTGQLTSGFTDALFQCFMLERMEQDDLSIFHFHSQILIHGKTGFLQDRFGETNSLAVAPFLDLNFHDGYLHMNNGIYIVYTIGALESSS